MEKNNWPNILWIVIIIVVIIIIYNNFCSRENIESFSNLAKNVSLQSNLSNNNAILNHNLNNILQNDNIINKNASNLMMKKRDFDEKNQDVYIIPNLPESSYEAINGPNNDEIKYPIKINNTTNLLQNSKMTPSCPNMVNNSFESCVPNGTNMCAQGVEMKPYGYSFNDNQQEDNEFLNWVSKSENENKNIPTPTPTPQQQ